MRIALLRRLECGSTRQLGQFVCTSLSTGVTCVNRHGHGLFVSRQTYRLW